MSYPIVNPNLAIPIGIAGPGPSPDLPGVFPSVPPAGWVYDFDPATQSARANFNGEVTGAPAGAYPAGGLVPPPGTAPTSTPTTYFLNSAGKWQVPGTSFTVGILPYTIPANINSLLIPSAVSGGNLNLPDSTQLPYGATITVYIEFTQATTINIGVTNASDTVRLSDPNFAVTNTAPLVLHAPASAPLGIVWQVLEFFKSNDNEYILSNLSAPISAANGGTPFILPGDVTGPVRTLGGTPGPQTVAAATATVTSSLVLVSRAAGATLTLPSAAIPGQEIIIKATVTTTGTVISSASNVIGLQVGTTSTAILPIGGKYAHLIADGGNWQMVAQA